MYFMDDQVASGAVMERRWIRGRAGLTRREIDKWEHKAIMKERHMDTEVYGSEKGFRWFLPACGSPGSQMRVLQLHEQEAEQSGLRKKGSVCPGSDV